MPALRTEVTEIVTGLGMLGVESLDVPQGWKRGDPVEAAAAPVDALFRPGCRVRAKSDALPGGDSVGLPPASCVPILRPVARHPRGVELDNAEQATLAHLRTGNGVTRRHPGRQPRAKGLYRWSAAPPHWSPGTDHEHAGELSASESVSMKGSATGATPFLQLPGDCEQVARSRRRPLSLRRGKAEPET